MVTHPHHNLSVVEAVETLSSIADLTFDRDIGIAKKHEVILGDKKIAYRTVHWLHHKDASFTVSLVREIFRVILHYIRQFYKKEYRQVTDQKTLEGIKTIMVLVGEAAKKLDRYTQILHQTQSTTDLKEYKQLQEFYSTTIVGEINEGISFGLPQEKGAQEMTFAVVPKEIEALRATKHLFVDLETVKKDTEYELFFIRKEDGSRFFNPRLLRNIKLVCDFGSYFGERKELDPLEHIREWSDRVFHACAKEMLRFLGSRLDHFFCKTRRVNEQELLPVLSKALLALMLSSHAQNLVFHRLSKSCSEYFEDFQGFLREALQTDIYRKWITYPPKEGNCFAFDMIDLLHSLCRAFYTHLRGLEEVSALIHGLVQKAVSDVAREDLEEAQFSEGIPNKLHAEYSAMSKLLKHHPNGPLFKVLEILEEEAYDVFDPILQRNIPNRLYDLYVENRRYAFLRIPAPIHQGMINKAVVNDEFIGFLRSNPQGRSSKHLLINLQDRTSWREHFRCVALEQLQRHSDLESLLSVATLAIDTDFYHQLNPYHELSDALLFKVQFKELLLDENGGYYFPPSVNRGELFSFIDDAFAVIHGIFFSFKNAILREGRLDFIELFHLLLQLKLIEWSRAETISLTCKDSIDTGEAYSIALFVFLKLINGQEWTDYDWCHLNVMLYAPSVLIRERVMLPERFNRMLSALKVVDHACHAFGAEELIKGMQEGAGARLFNTGILRSEVLLPR